MACRILCQCKYNNIIVQSEHPLTKEKLVLVYKVRSTKIYGAKNEDEWLGDAVQERDHENQDSLRIHSAIIDHRRCVQFSKICLGSLNI